MRIEHAQHARDGAVVDGFVGADRFGVVLLDEVVHLRKGAQAVADIAVGDGGCR